jgi:hypothetical protein
MAGAAYATRSQGLAPRITMSRDGGSCRIRHKEFITSITGSTAFAVPTSISVNPGLAASFPWLSSVANSWEEYKFHKLDMIYLTRTGTNVPGSLLMSPDYDAADAAPSSEVVASAYQDSAEDAPWKDNVCRLKASSLQGTNPRRITRSGPLAANLDIKMYDAAVIHICTIDGTAVNWGKIWVEYDVELFIPQLPSAGPCPLGGQIDGANTMTAANPFGVAPVVDPTAAGITMNTASVLTFLATGTYLVVFSYSGTVISATSNVGTNVTVTSNLTTINAAALACTGTFVAVVTQPGGTVAMTATATTITASEVKVGSAPTDSLL